MCVPSGASTPGFSQRTPPSVGRPRLVDDGHRQLGRGSASYANDTRCHTHLDRPSVAATWCPDSSTSCCSLPVHGRVRFGMGCPSSSTLRSVSLTMVPRRGGATQQRAGTFSGTASNSDLVPTIDRTVPHGTDGQHDSVCVHTQARRNEIPDVVSAGDGASDILRCSQHHARSASHPRTTKCHCGRAVSATTFTNRVVTQQGRISGHSTPLPGDGNRLVCNTLQCQTAPVYVTVSGRHSNSRGRPRL